jgi:hypothetical protein
VVKHLLISIRSCENRYNVCHQADTGNALALAVQPMAAINFLVFARDDGIQSARLLATKQPLFSPVATIPLASSHCLQPSFITHSSTKENLYE